MNNQRARIADIGQVAEQFHTLNQLNTSFVAALEAKRKDRASAIRAIFPAALILLVFEQTRILNPAHFLMA